MMDSLAYRNDAATVLRRLKEELSSEGVDIVAVPIDEADDNPRLAAYAQQWKPTSRLANLVPAGGLHPVAPKPSTEMSFTWVAALALKAARDLASSDKSECIFDRHDNPGHRCTP